MENEMEAEVTWGIIGCIREVLHDPKYLIAWE